ncbi:hypothetical protein HMPREF0645_0979 [Hallella bergensis DSM 17361]|uniref:Uncharacterized protein n=1 Tax=Hallella bergensis DSM 17361 TaxID=585502 RepID=D1PVJ4_9BACT|nr:hypothetical protein HMPREF0645_0979 [Hallella bergensis DSM 17361]
MRQRLQNTKKYLGLKNLFKENETKACNLIKFILSLQPLS